jgi:flap endonuclease-1
MGVLDLLRFINKNFKAGAKKYPIEKFKQFVVSVDTSLFLHGVGAAVRSGGADLLNEKGQLTSHLFGLFYKTLKFLEQNITPIYVFDGKPLKLKSYAATERKEKRKKAQDVLDKLDKLEKTEENAVIFAKNFAQTFSLSDEDIIEAKILLDLMGVPYIQAPEEADDVCAWLAARVDEEGNPYVRGVCSDDSDMLVLGAPYLFQSMIKSGSEITVYSLEKILAAMKLSWEQFVEFSVFCGTDYCERIPGLGPAKIYPLIIKYGSMEKVFEYLRQNNKFGFSPDKEPCTTMNANVKISECYEAVKRRYLDALDKLDNSKTFVITDDNLRLKLCQKKELLDFMHTKHGFELQRIQKGIDRLVSYHKIMGITRENKKPVHKVTSKHIASLNENFTYISAVKILDSDDDDDFDDNEPDSESSEEHVQIPNKSKPKNR